MHKHDIDASFITRAKRLRDGRLNAHESLDAAKTALVVVDMQNYFVADGMPAAAPVAKAIVPNINRLAQTVRASGGIVIWIQTEALINEPDDWANRKEANSAEGWSRRQTLLARDGAGYPIYPTCEVLPEDKFAVKIRYSAFIPYPSELEAVLKQNSIDTLLITGVATSSCCEFTGRDASMWGYRTIMVSDGNADQSDDLHNHTLGKFLVTFGDVQSTDELIEKLQGSRHSTAAE